jgi:membrane protease YdiL (CAAX protease family)
MKENCTGSVRNNFENGKSLISFFMSIMDFPDISDHFIAFLFGLALPVVSGFRTARSLRKIHFNEQQRKRFYVFNSLFLWTLTIVVLLNWWFHGRSASVMGITQSPRFTSAVLIMTIGVITLYILDIFIVTKSEATPDKKLWTEIAPFLPAKHSELPAYIFMCITAGICEEIIFRGFLIPYAKTFFTTDLPAVIIPAAVFAAVHFYQRTAAVIKIFMLSVIFGFIFLESGSLWIVMFLHFGIDLAGGLIVLKYRKEEKTERSIETEAPLNDESDEKTSKKEM